MKIFISIGKVAGDMPLIVLALAFSTFSDNQCEPGNLPCNRAIHFTWLHIVIYLIFNTSFEGHAKLFVFVCGFSNHHFSSVIAHRQNAPSLHGEMIQL
jgi:hypothetical protein